MSPSVLKNPEEHLTILRSNLTMEGKSQYLNYLLGGENMQAVVNVLYLYNRVASDGLRLLLGFLDVLVAYEGPSVGNVLAVFRNISQLLVEREREEPSRMLMPPRPQGRCLADSDGDCSWSDCPQRRDGEPARSGRSCPLLKDHGGCAESAEDCMLIRFTHSTKSRGIKTQ